VTHGTALDIPPVITGSTVLGPGYSSVDGLVYMSRHDEITQTLDAKGEVCPIPLAKTKQTVDTLDDGGVLEVLTTEPNSVPDFESWAELTDDVELVDQVETDQGDESVYKHYVKKTE
jgi:TusA-related sulfurtransferase